MFFKSHKKCYCVDMHSHILPAVDDGAQDIEESLEMMRVAYDSGIRQMIVTPHYKRGRHNASAQTIMEKITELEDFAMQKGYDISLFPGNEIYYFEGLVDALENQEVLTLNGTDRVLIEFSPNEQFTYIRNAFDEVIGAGYVPVMAHVERYECMVSNPEFVYELKDMGVEIQSNAASIEGKYGKTIQKFLLKLLNDEIIDYVGTDAHNADSRKPSMEECCKVLQKKISPEYMAAIISVNAEELIDKEVE